MLTILEYPWFLCQMLKAPTNYPLAKHPMMRMKFICNEKRDPGCLGYIGDSSTQLCGDYNKPLQGSLLNNPYNGK